jgi:16S rRNA (guanine966-N2)-methyltransferase
MRIISGRLKSRRIDFPNLGDAEGQTRPTTDFARESLFNLLYNWRAIDELEEPNALDLFSGTGAVGFEFVSRGATRVDFVEKSNVCIASIARHAKLFGVEAQCKLNKSDVFTFLKTASSGGVKYDYVFADPPYSLPNIPKLPELIIGANILKPSGILIVEHDDRYTFSAANPHWVESRAYGKSRFSFFQVAEAEAEEDTNKIADL